MQSHYNALGQTGQLTNSMKLELQPTTKVEDRGTMRKRRTKVEQSEEEGSAQDEDDDEDDEAEIGTHRKESNQASTNELAVVNRFGSTVKN